MSKRAKNQNLSPKITHILMLFLMYLAGEDGERYGWRNGSCGLSQSCCCYDGTQHQGKTFLHCYMWHSALLYDNAGCILNMTQWLDDTIGLHWIFRHISCISLSWNLIPCWGVLTWVCGGNQSILTFINTYIAGITLTTKCWSCAWCHLQNDLTWNVGEFANCSHEQ